MQIKVIGCGNELLGDDAIGLLAARELMKQKLPQNVSVIEAGTPGLQLLDMMEDVDKAVIIDAVISGNAIGTVHRFTDQDLPNKSMLPLSLHGFNIVDAIELGRKLGPNKLPKEIVILGIEVADKRNIEIGVSKEVSNALPKVIEKVINEL